MRKILHILNPNAKIRAEERTESIREGGVEEARLFRDLTAEEQKLLEKRFRNSLHVKNNFWWILTFSIVADALFFYSIYLFLEKGKGGDLFGIGVMAFIVVGALQVTLFTIAAKENEQYLDLRKQVFKVQGKAILPKDQNQKGLTIEVRNFIFSSDKQPELTPAIQQVNFGDEVAVEFSPHSRHVWKIYKTEDI